MGSLLLEALTNRDYYSEIICYNRKLQQNSGIVSYRVYQKDSAGMLEGIDTTQTDIFCCIGTTIKKAGTLEKFLQVDYELVLQIAKIYLESNCRSFHFISSIGASENSSSPYLRTKGKVEAELKIMKSKLTSLFLYRPNVFRVKREEFRLLEVLSMNFLYLISPLLVGKLKRFRPTDPSNLVTLMIHNLNLVDGEVRLFNNEEIL